MPAKCWREALQGPSSGHFFLSAPDWAGSLTGVAVGEASAAPLPAGSAAGTVRRAMIAARKIPAAAPVKPARRKNVIAALWSSACERPGPNPLNYLSVAQQR